MLAVWPGFSMTIERRRFSIACGSVGSSRMPMPGYAIERMFDPLERRPRTRDTVAVVTYDPMLLSPARRIPNGDQWAHEPKLDGMRCGVVVVDGRVRVWSRRLRDWTAA